MTRFFLKKDRTLIIKFPSGFQNDRTNLKRQDICARLTTVSKDTEDKKKHVCHLEFPCFANDSVVWLSLGLLGEGELLYLHHSLFRGVLFHILQGVPKVHFSTL